MNNDLIHINTLPPFKRMCVSIGALPTSFMESMTYYEALEWLYNYLDKTVIPAINTEGEAITELQTAFITLKDYIDNYFENLDVQEEINNKLDDMAESGELTDIIAQYLGLAGVLAFNTVADMKQATNLVNGSICKTLGYYNVNDGGGTFYKISDTIDNTEHQETLDSGLYATLIHLPNHYNVLTLGCKVNDNTFDNSVIINANIKERTTYFFPYGEYFIDNPIVITKSHINIVGENERTRITKTSANGVDITIETSKGTTYNLNNYDMCFYIGKATTSSGTVSLVKLKDISIKGYDSTDTSHNILIIGCSYLKTENIQLIDYNKGILINDSFACNFDYVTALTFGSNRSAIEIIDSTAIYVSNSYLNGGYYSLNITRSRVYADNIACDAHGYVFLVQNNSYFDIINSRCETYANVMNCDTASYCNVSNCDFEGHGETFEWFIKANTNSNVVIKNSVLRYQVYDGDNTPASINLFRAENSGIINAECYTKTPNITLVKFSQTGGTIYYVDLNIDGKKGDITPETGITITDKDIDIKDGYVNVYISGKKSSAFTKNSAINIGTISGLPFPPNHAHRFIGGTSQNNAYSANNPAYFGINTSGILSIMTSVDSQEYFIVCTRYKVN